jgi:ribosomal-protein-alanine N-acetyltransferase
MDFQISLTTDRLLIEHLTLIDNKFIFELVNSEDWLKFIGNRNINSTDEATAYIRKIIDNPNLFYWVVRIKDSKLPIGIISIIKRDYLQYHDIGFAFLSSFANKGYAYEATMAVLKSVIQTHNLSHILATTIPENISSIRLLEKIGLHFEKEIETDNVKLCVYGVSIDKL